jgi:HD-like signal output (HDOD) protein
MDIFESLRHSTKLPSPPGIVMEVIELAEMVDVSIEEVEHVVVRDPALAARVIRIANSAIYSPHLKVTTIKEAIIRVGLSEIVTICLQFSYSSMVDERSKPGLIAIWQRGLLSSYAARVLGGFFSRKDIAQLQLAALLQDVGVLALDVAIPHIYDPLLGKVSGHDALVKAEVEVLDAGHAEVGGWLLREWGFPEYLAVAVGASNSVPRPTDDDPNFEDLIVLSGAIADVIVSAEPDQTLRAHKEAFDWLQRRGERHLPERGGMGFVDRLFLKMSEVVNDVVQLYSQDIFSTGMLGSLSDRAEELVTARLLALHNTMAPSSSGLPVQIAMRGSAQSQGFRGIGPFREILDFHIVRVRAGVYPVSLICLECRHEDNQEEIKGSVQRAMEHSFRGSDPIFEFKSGYFVVLLAGANKLVSDRLAERLIENVLQSGKKLRQSLPDLSARFKVSSLSLTSDRASLEVDEIVAELLDSTDCETARSLTSVSIEGGRGGE